MSSASTTREHSTWETGRLAPGDARLFRPGGMELTAHAMSLAGIRPRARIIDLGCGAGETVRYLRAQGHDAMGIDCAPAPGPVEDTPRLVACADHLPLADASVDAVFAECSVSLFDDRGLALAECARVLVDGGRLVLSDLYARQAEALRALRPLDGSCAARILIREELEADLAGAGFRVDVWEDHSRALRECAARYLFEYGSLDGLWGCGGGESSRDIQAAMRAARAGYFLLLATRRSRSGGKNEAPYE